MGKERFTYYLNPDGYLRAWSSHSRGLLVPKSWKRISRVQALRRFGLFKLELEKHCGSVRSETLAL